MIAVSADTWLLVKRQSCLPCTDPIAPCQCTASQSCVQTARSCTQCAQNICQANDNPPSAGGAKSSIGGTVGGALGGVLGICAALAALYYFWWKPRGLAASRRRYSKRVTARQSRLQAAAPTGEKKSPSSPTSPNPDSPTDGVAKRSSVHLRIDGRGADTLSHRASSPGRSDAEEASSAGATRGHRESMSEFDADNPFGDHARSSVGTSDFSFRSSHSTNIIPIAYIPPHSSSMSLDDAQRDAYGELDSGANHLERRASGFRDSVPTSFVDSRDSLALAGADSIMLNPLPPVLTPGSPIIPFSASSSGGPIRPPRSPGLDLQLPKGSVRSTPTSPLASPPGRPGSGFPFGTTSPDADTSHFSMSTKRASANSWLTAPGHKVDRGMSVLGEKPNHHLSTISTMSSSTSRSGNSTMSYILDPPQIITPVNAQALRRVEVLGRGQAGLVRIPGSVGPTAPSSPAVDESESLGSGLSPPTTPKALVGASSTFTKQQDATPQGDDADPFADTARFSVGGLTATPQTTPRPASTGAQSESEAEAGYATELGYGTSHSNDSRWTMSSNDSDMPHSPRASGVDTGRLSRPLTGVSWTPKVVVSDDARASVASSTSDLSMLDGIPFMAASSSSSTAPVQTPSPFPMPPPRTPSMIATPPSPVAVNSPLAPAPSQDASPDTDDPSHADSSTDAPEAPLPLPFRPFAQEGGAMGGGPGARQSEISIRSGFGSGLSQIPFTLGFPEIDGSSARGSVMTMDSRMGDESRNSYADTEGDDGMLSGVDEVTEPDSSRPNSSLSVKEEVDPFGAHAEVLSPGEGQADPRASSDSMAMALSLELARNLDGLDE